MIDAETEGDPEKSDDVKSRVPMDNLHPFVPSQVGSHETPTLEGTPAPTENSEAFSDADEAEDGEPEIPAEIELPIDPELSPEGAEDAFEKLTAEAKKYSPEHIRRIIESILFVADKPLPEETIRKNTGIELKTIHEQLVLLQEHHCEGRSGIVLHEVAGGWQLRTSPESADVIRRFLKVKPQRLTRAALETLAIVAYRQPVTRPEIEDIRAVDSGAVLKALLERRLVKILGKREEAGRPLIYGTTREFLEFFNLRDLSGLPTLREFQELSKESEDVIEKELGPEAIPLKGVGSIVQDLRDDAFEAKLKESTFEADAALADLEQALADSEEASRETRELLDADTASEADENASEEG